MSLEQFGDAKAHVANGDYAYCCANHCGRSHAIIAEDVESAKVSCKDTSRSRPRVRPRADPTQAVSFVDSTIRSRNLYPARDS